jgi:hypothetical protein
MTTTLGVIWVKPFRSWDQAVGYVGNGRANLQSGNLNFEIEGQKPDKVFTAIF